MGLLISATAPDLDSILKSRDITLLTKVRLVKARVFPEVIYGCYNGAKTSFSINGAGKSGQLHVKE